MNGQKNERVQTCLAQGDIACNSKKQNSPFVECKWKPGFVIEFSHYFPSRKTSKILTILL